VDIPGSIKSEINFINTSVL